MLVEIQFFHDKASQTSKYHLNSQSFRRIVWIQNFALKQFNPNLVLKMTNFTKHMAKLNQIVHLIFGKNILDHGLISMFGLVGNSL